MRRRDEEKAETEERLSKGSLASTRLRTALPGETGKLGTSCSLSLSLFPSQPNGNNTLGINNLLGKKNRTSYSKLDHQQSPSRSSSSSPRLNAFAVGEPRSPSCLPQQHLTRTTRRTNLQYESPRSPSNTRPLTTLRSAALLDLLSQSTSTPSPTTLAYLRHSVGLRSSTTSSSSTSKPLVRPSYLASHAFLRPNAALSTLDSTFSIVLAALDAAGDSAPTYSATSVEGVLEGVAIAASLVLAQLSAVNSSASSTRPTSSTTSIHSPTLTYIIRFLTSPPIRINPKRVEEDVVERCVRSLNTTIDALEGFTPSTSSVSNDAAFVTILRLKLISTRSVLDSRPQERVQAPVHLDEEPTTSADPDLAFLISDLVRAVSLPPSSHVII